MSWVWLTLMVPLVQVGLMLMAMMVVVCLARQVQQVRESMLALLVWRAVPEQVLWQRVVLLEPLALV